MKRSTAKEILAASFRELAQSRNVDMLPFLIASITCRCNLHCAGCCSCCNNATVDGRPVDQLTDEEWLRIFDDCEYPRGAVG